MKKKTVSFLSFFMFLTISISTADAFDTSDIRIHGFISQGYLKTDHNNYLAETEDGTFQFNEFGINFMSRPLDNLRIGMQLFARDLGNTGNDEVDVDWVYGDYRWRDYLGLRIGKIRMVHGLYNETREMDMLITPVILPQSVYPELWRDSFSTIKGVAIYGSRSWDSAGTFSYDAQFGVMDVKPEGGFVRNLEAALSRYNYNFDITDSGTDYLYTLGLLWECPDDRLKLGITLYDIHGLMIEGNGSGLFPHDVDGDGTTGTSEAVPFSGYRFTSDYIRGFIVSAEYRIGNAVFTAEYAEEVNDGDSDYGFIRKERAEVKRKGWYVLASYRFNPLFSASVSYSELIPDINDEKGVLLAANGRNDFEAWLKTITLSTRFDVARNCLLKFEVSHNDGWMLYDSMQNSVEDLKPYWWLFAAKATVSF